MTSVAEFSAIWTCRRFAYDSGASQPANDGQTPAPAQPSEERPVGLRNMQIPKSTQSGLHLRLSQRQRERWPQLVDVRVRCRAPFAYVDGVFPDGEVIPLCRLRYGGSASLWGFAIYLGSSNRYEDSILPTGAPIGTPQEALDCACGLYLADTSARVTT